MSAILLGCGLAAAGIGTWRSYAAARAAIAPLVHDGDPTRTAIEATRPVLLRSKVRLFARRIATSIVWLGVAFYGAFMASVAAAMAS
jgi:hypothetical protein